MAQKYLLNLKDQLPNLAAILLWVICSGLAVWEILIVRAMVVRVTTQTLMSFAGLTETMATVSAYKAGAVVTLIMSVIALVIVLVGLDPSSDQIGKFPAWKVLSWILVGQVIVLGFAFLL